MGQVCGERYRIDQVLGSGAMGTVYRGTDLRTDRPVAIKLIKAELTQSPDVVQRFYRESEILLRLRHPNTVRLMDRGELSDGRLYMVTEYLEGMTLSDRMRQPDFGPDRVLRVVQQICGPLAEAHSIGVVHRDLKPANVFVMRLPTEEVAKVLDFGIARLTHPTDHDLTEQGSIMGTVAYMSPEQARGEVVDGRADLYALGVILYRGITGEHPFRADSVPALLLKHMTEAPAPPRDRSGQPPPLDVEALILDLLAKNPDERPSTAQEVEARIEAIRNRLGSLTGTLPEALPGPPTEPNATVAGSSRPSLGSEVPATVPDVDASRGVDGTPTSSPSRRFVLPGLAAMAVLAAVFLALGGTTQPRREAHIETRPAPPPGPDVGFEGGEFEMGSSSEEVRLALQVCQRTGSDRCEALVERETPVRRVRLSPFRLDRREVTQGEWADWLDRNRERWTVEHDRIVRREGVVYFDAHAGDGTPNRVEYIDGRFRVAPEARDLPAVQMTWEGASTYCGDRGGRLPTEAEWAYAARGSERRNWPWGSDAPSCDGVRTAEAACEAPTRLLPVATSRQDVTPAGVHDMGASVAEFVEDAFSAPYPSCNGCTDPVHVGGPDSDHVVRGGTFDQGAEATRAATRSKLPAGGVASNVGFRCARS